ncbi:longitudinals lacking protein, isoforms F/I/K/T-like [Odontomachus brunneus]|uniref:longitudinals lacking protein, isoforms F/I/K/T-like n=1 Tax=Odontomachus brunneus TaxID=486640 RepID=UPI0013F29EF6|nr:longitudinals lacking protein, isoforms F/I/K/T-like [Odontomachus brunneus]
MMLAAATRCWSQSTTGLHRQPMADYCRLSCPRCGRSYKYRSGLLGHIAECLSKREKVEPDFRQRQEQEWQQRHHRHQQQQQQRDRSHERQQPPHQSITVKDVRVLYKFWTPRSYRQLSQGHVCKDCGKIYKQRNALWRHYKYECGKSPRFQCPYCRYRTKQRSNMYSHIKHKHIGLKIYAIDLEAGT